MSFIVESLVQGLLIDGWATLRRRRELRKGIVGDVVECSVRSVGASIPGLRGEWLQGRAFFGPGHLTVERREGAVARIEIAVLRVDRSRARRPQGQEAWRSVRPEFEIWRLVTSSGDVEWAVDHRIIEAATALLTPRPR